MTRDYKASLLIILLSISNVVTGFTVSSPTNKINQSIYPFVSSSSSQRTPSVLHVDIIDNTNNEQTCPTSKKNVNDTELLRQQDDLVQLESELQEQLILEKVVANEPSISTDEVTEIQTIMQQMDPTLLGPLV